MSKKSWWKLGLLVAGSTVAALQVGACITDTLMMLLIEAVVN